MKNSKGILIIGIVSGLILISIVSFSISLDENKVNEENNIVKDVGVYSGPLTITQYEHKLGESVFFHVKGLQPNEKGNIHVFTPQGILFKTYQYDGSVKSDFSQYFTPDTYKPSGICKPDELVGKWKMVFEDGSYPTLEFEFTNEFIRSGEVNIQVVC